MERLWRSPHLHPGGGLCVGVRHLCVCVYVRVYVSLAHRFRSPPLRYRSDGTKKEPFKIGSMVSERVKVFRRDAAVLAAVV